MADITGNTRSQSSGIRTISLRGELGRKYGRRHRYAVSTPAEAIRALCANHPTFKRDLIESQTRGVGYKVIVGRKSLPDVSRVHDPMGRADMTIVPVVGGGKSGFGQVVLGAVLIAASFYLPGIGGTLVGAIRSMGVSMALGGISSLIGGSPKATAAVERPENAPSYFFDGAVNTISQGQPIPIGYGRMRVGGAIISAGIDADEIPAT